MATSSLTETLFRPEDALVRMGRDIERAPIVLSSSLGAMLLPAIFELSRGNKFFLLWSNPITWVAVGVLFGLAWVQGVAFPAAMLSGAIGGRVSFPATRTAVATSLLPCVLLLFAYWLIRLASFRTLAGDFLEVGWVLAALWSLENFRRCLTQLHRLRPARARSVAAASGFAGVWVSLLVGMIPFVVVGAMIAIHGRVYRPLLD